MKKIKGFIALLLTSVFIFGSVLPNAVSAKKIEKELIISFSSSKTISNSNQKKYKIKGSTSQSSKVIVSFTDKSRKKISKTYSTTKNGSFNKSVDVSSLKNGNVLLEVKATSGKKSSYSHYKIVQKNTKATPKPKPTPTPTTTPEPTPETTPTPTPISIPTPEQTPSPVVEVPVTKSFPKGTGVSTYYDGENDLNFNKDAGFNVVRADLYWSWIEEEKGVYNFEVNNYDTMVNSLLSKGMTPYMVLVYSNKLYGEDGASIKTEAGRKGYIKYVDVVTKRYAGKGIVWEIYNEPNGFWGDSYSKEYATLAIEAAKTIRKNDPTGYIVAPALAGTSPDSFNYLERVFKEGILEYIDAVSVHPYRSWEPESAWYEYDVLRTLISEYTDKELRIVNGEWGYSTTQGWWDLYLTDKQQGAYAVRMFLTDKMNDVDISIWYNWKNNSNDKQNSEHNFGLLEANGTPKIGYHAVDTFHALTEGYEYRERIALDSEDDYLVRFVNENGKSVYIAWTVDNTHEANLPNNTIKATVKDMLGENQGSFDSGTSIQLSEFPTYIIEK